MINQPHKKMPLIYFFNDINVLGIHTETLVKRNAKICVSVSQDSFAGNFSDPFKGFSEHSKGFSEQSKGLSDHSKGLSELFKELSEDFKGLSDYFKGFSGKFKCFSDDFKDFTSFYLILIIW